MMEPLLPYSGTLVSSVVLAALVLLQVLVVDFAGIRARHVPGTPVTSDHGSFLFRATRAHANTNESLPVQVLLVLLAILLGAQPGWTAYATAAFAAARAAHMACYYADWRIARSVAFAAGLAAQFALLIVVALALR